MTYLEEKKRYYSIQIIQCIYVFWYQWLVTAQSLHRILLSKILGKYCFLQEIDTWKLILRLDANTADWLVEEVVIWSIKSVI